MSPCPHGQGYANPLNFGIQVLRDLWVQTLGPLSQRRPGGVYLRPAASARAWVTWAGEIRAVSVFASAGCCSRTTRRAGSSPTDLALAVSSHDSPSTSSLGLIRLVDPVPSADSPGCYQTPAPNAGAVTGGAATSRSGILFTATEGKFT